MAFEITLNGQAERVEAPGDTPLLWVLRDTLGMTGTKFGCGKGLCRSCTVHVEGRPMQSCQVLLSDAAGRRVTTIEGLSEDGTHPVQRAWIAEDVPQCGYCQSGQIMTAVALLEETPRPADADIDRAMSPVICRCGTYTKIRKAIHRAAGSWEGGEV